MKTVLIVSFSIITLSLASCSAEKNHPANAKPLSMFSNEKKSAYLVDYDASRRGSIVYIDYETNKINIISEPPPDAMVSVLSELDAKVDVTGKVSAELANKYAETITQLGKRSVADNILRDALYRLNEYKLNFGSFDADSKELFNRILNVAESIANTEQAALQNDIKEKEVEQDKIELEKLKIEQSNIDLPQVKQFESDGYQAILDGDFENGLLNFTNCENAYPRYHNAYDISTYLKFVKTKNVDPKTIIKTVLDKYSYGMTSEMKSKYSEKSK